MTEKDELVEVVAEMLRRQGLDEVRAVGTATRAIASIRPTIVEEVLRETYSQAQSLTMACSVDWWIEQHAKDVYGLDLTQDGER